MLLHLKAPLLIGCHDVPEHHAFFGTALHGCSAVSSCYQRSEASPDHLSLQACSLAKHCQNHLSSVTVRITLTPLGDMGRAFSDGQRFQGDVVQWRIPSFQVLPPLSLQRHNF